MTFFTYNGISSADFGLHIESKNIFSAPEYDISFQSIPGRSGDLIVSNNRSSARVEEFCRDLGVPYQGHAGKPGTRGLTAAMARAGASRRQTAMLGDKLLTDVMAANRCGILPLMVEPLGGAVTAWQKVLHALQEPFKEVCRRREGEIFQKKPPEN